MPNFTKPQWILVLLAMLNLAIVLLFPPFDDIAISKHDISVFAGFMFVFSAGERYQINGGLLYLEVTVVAINFLIFWLMIHENQKKKEGEKLSYRSMAMILTACNLVGVLLFPPFEYVSNMTRAVIPTFEGFYFIFSPPPYRVVVTTLLYLEVILVLINAALMLLVFRKPQAGKDAMDNTMNYLAKLKAEAAKQQKAKP